MKLAARILLIIFCFLFMRYISSLSWRTGHPISVALTHSKLMDAVAEMRVPVEKRVSVIYSVIFNMLFAPFETRIGPLFLQLNNPVDV